jgi:hypothetical protein
MVNELSYIIGLIALWLYLYDDTCIPYGIRFRNLCFHNRSLEIICSKKDVKLMLSLSFYCFPTKLREHMVENSNYKIF